MSLPFSNDIKTLRFLADEMTQGDLGDKVGVVHEHGIDAVFAVVPTP